MNGIAVDLKEWIRPNDEDDISYRSRGSDAIIDLEHEVEGTPTTTSVVFERARYFTKQPFPGFNFMKGDVSIKGIPEGVVGQVSDSEFLRLCNEDADRLGYSSSSSYFHYVFYHYELGVMFHAIATGVSVEQT